MAIVTVRRGDAESVRFVGVAKHPGMGATVAKTLEASVRDAAAGEGLVDEVAIASPAGVPEGHSVVRLERCFHHGRSPRRVAWVTGRADEP